MCRAWPMLSAKTVAQKPGGNASPLSSLGHGLSSAAAACPGFCCANTDAEVVHSSADATNTRVRYVCERENGIGPPIVCASSCRVRCLLIDGEQLLVESADFSNAVDEVNWLGVLLHLLPPSRRAFAILYRPPLKPAVVLRIAVATVAAPKCPLCLSPSPRRSPDYFIGSTQGKHIFGTVAA